MISMFLTRNFRFFHNTTNTKQILIRNLMTFMIFTIHFWNSMILECAMRIPNDLSHASRIFWSTTIFCRCGFLSCGVDLICSCHSTICTVQRCEPRKLHMIIMCIPLQGTAEAFLNALVCATLPSIQSCQQLLCYALLALLGLLSGCQQHSLALSPAEPLESNLQRSQGPTCRPQNPKFTLLGPQRKKGPISCLTKKLVAGLMPTLKEGQSMLRLSLEMMEKM